MKRFQLFTLIVSLGLVNFMHAHQQINVDEFYPMEMVDIGYIQTHPLLHTIKSRSVTSVDLHTPPIGNQGQGVYVVLLKDQNGDIISQTKISVQ